MICEYGCGQEARYKLGNERWCCSQSQNSCSVMKRKNSEAQPRTTYTRTENHRKKMSELLMGIPKKEEHKKILSIRAKARFKIPEERDKCINNGKQKRVCKECGKRLQHKGDRCWTCYSKWFQGENHWNWQGGKKKIIYSSTFRDKKLREELKKEFPYCLGCLFEGKSVEGNCLHHIDYDKSNDTKGNLLWLCRSHHASTNFDREFFKRFLSNFKKSPRPKVLGIDIRGGEL